MKIALINSEYPSHMKTGHGGIATYTYLSANALAELGHSVHVLIREESAVDPLVDGVRLHRFSHKPASRLQRIIDRLFKKSGNITWEKAQSRHIADILKSIYQKDGLDIVEFPEYGGLAHQIRSFPVVINFHTPLKLVDSLNNVIPSKIRQQLYNFEHAALKNAAGFRCPSEALKEIVCKDYGLPERSVEVIRNPVSTKTFDHIDKIRIDDRIDILFSGRLEYRKGAELLSRSIKKIMQVNSKINMTFAGETEMGDALCYRQAIERSLTDEQRKRVWFLGPLDRNMLSALYCRSSIFLFPSLFENAPYSLFEAIAAKLPVIASASGGIKEIIHHRENGLLFSSHSIDELIECIKVYIENPEFGELMAQRAYLELQKNYAPGKIAAQSVDFYQSLPDSKRKIKHTR